MQLFEGNHVIITKGEEDKRRIYVLPKEIRAILFRKMSSLSGIYSCTIGVDGKSLL